MIRIAAKSAVSVLPAPWQAALRRMSYGRRIRRGTFVSPEPEFALLDSLVSPGDWVLDVGANVGVYAVRLSELVGPSGRVVALEPMPDTFGHLAANVGLLPRRNVTLLNVAATEHPAVLGMEVPASRGHAWARVTDNGGAFSVVGLPVDSLPFPCRVSLVKIDVEGHEWPALRGMRELLKRDKPAVLVETHDARVAAFMRELGYGDPSGEAPNFVFR